MKEYSKIEEKARISLFEKGDVVEITRVKTNHPNHKYNVGDRLKVVRALYFPDEVYLRVKERKLPISSKTYEWVKINDTSGCELSHVDWEQRRYEIAREMLPYAAETSRSILMSGHSLGDDAKGKTLAEVCASSAVSFADALIAELRKQPNPETKPEKQPDKKEVAIGEVVEYQGEHLLCVEKTDNEDCSGCAFLAEDDDCKFSGHCHKDYRSDGKNVIFVKGGSSEA